LKVPENLNAGFFLAGTSTGSPVLGFLLVLAGTSLTDYVPNPLIVTAVPCRNDKAKKSTNASTTDFDTGSPYPVY
jgi:hypothetical protein